jgi:CDP-diacylglycerol---glycerol-3-phosphate 3-phosphatidyltransferase
VRGLVRAGVTPNAITIFGFAGAVATAVLVGFQQWIAAGIVFVIGSVSDMFDGSVARMTGKATRFGAFLDSSLDRLGEGFVLGGIGVALAREGSTWAVGMTFAALAGSFLVSYTRARAEGLGVDSNKGGLMSRTERLVLVGAGIFFGGVGPVLEIVVTILAVGTLVTVAQRLSYVHSTLRDADGTPDDR